MPVLLSLALLLPGFCFASSGKFQKAPLTYKKSKNGDWTVVICGAGGGVTIEEMGGVAYPFMVHSCKKSFAEMKEFSREGVPGSQDQLQSARLRFPCRNKNPGKNVKDVAALAKSVCANESASPLVLEACRRAKLP